MSEKLEGKEQKKGENANNLIPGRERHTAKCKLRATADRSQKLVRDKQLPSR